MPIKEFSVYNETRENFLSTRVTVIDTKSEPLKAVKALIEGLAPNTETGLWLNPLKKVPTVPRLSSYDLVYLDQECRVVQGVALIADDDVPPFDGQAASALVLPIHTFSASQSHPGDKVVLCATGEEEAEAERAPVVAPAVVDAPAPSTALQLSLPVLAIEPARVEGSIDTPSLAIQEAAIRPGFQRERGLLGLLRVLPRLRLRVSISITVAQPKPPAPPAMETWTLPAPAETRADEASPQPPRTPWLAPRISGMKKRLGEGKRRYLRMAEIFVYGSERVTPRSSSSSAHRFPRLEEEC
jgi:hypothetical protein